MRHLTPAVEVEAGLQHLALDDGARALLGPEVEARQEHHADADRRVPRFVPGVAHLGGEEVPGQADQNAGAVAGASVGVHGAAVEDGLERLQGQFDDLAAGLAVNGGDEADAAGVML